MLDFGHENQDSSFYIYLKLCGWFVILARHRSLLSQHHRFVVSYKGDVEDALCVYVAICM